MMGRKIMGETGIKPIVIEEICDLAKKYNVKKVILFGSRARGSFKEKSDIDWLCKAAISCILCWM